MKEIPLTQGRVTLVDDDDYLWVSQHKWSVMKSRHTFYAFRMTRKPDGKRMLLTLHRAITPTGGEVDHINRNGLDNRKSNLRPATASQNQANQVRTVKNKTGYRGVSPTESAHKWRADIKFHGKQFYLGTYGTPEDAARAYDAKLIELFGEYARPNFPAQPSAG